MLWLLLLCLTLLACNSTDSSSPSLTLGDEDEAQVEYNVILGKTPERTPSSGSMPELLLEPGDSTGEFVLTAQGEDTRICFASVEFNADMIHYVGAIGGTINPVVFLAIPVAPGVLHLGWAIPDYTEKTGSQGKIEIAKLKFAAGARSEQRIPTSLPLKESQKADRIKARWDLDGLDLLFIENSPGDYDGNGEVWISDIAPIADCYLEKIDFNVPENAISILDGDGNREIGKTDLNDIADNYLTKISGYAIQFSTDNGATWCPSDLRDLPTESIPFYSRTDSEYVDVDSTSGYNEWSIHLSPEAITSLNIPELDPSNNRMMIRVCAGNEEGFGLSSDSVLIEIPENSDKNPPVWRSTKGVSSLDPVPDYNTLAVEFDLAEDENSSPVVYRIYYDKAFNFIDKLELLNDNPAAIQFIDYTPSMTDKPPYSVELVGLTPGESYSVLVRARDSAFPNNNYENNEVVLSETVDQHSLGVDEIENAPGNLKTGYLVNLSCRITGASGDVSTYWSDSNSDAGFFVKQGKFAENTASIQWAAAVGNTTFEVFFEAVDADGKHAKQKKSLYLTAESGLNLNEHIYPLLKTRCISCHGSDAQSGLDLSTPEKAYNNLVNAPSTQKTGYRRIKPLIIDQSYLVCKIVESSSDRVNERMPKGGPYLTDTELQDITRWTIMGAQLGNLNPKAIHLGMPSLVRVDSGNAVTALPTGVLGQVSIPILTACTAPISLEIEIDGNEHGDAFIEPFHSIRDNNIFVMVGGDEATKYAVTINVEDKTGKNGSAEFSITVTDKDSRILSYASDIEPLIVPKCASCHAGLNPNLNEGNGYGNLVNKPSTITGWNYVTPGIASKSYLLNKLLSIPPAATAGQAIPHYVDTANESDRKEFINPVTEWIIGGAKP